MCTCAVTLWTGDMPEAERLVALLIQHSNKCSLSFWHFWGRCFELVIARRTGDRTSGRPVLRDPMCTPLYQETLASLDAELATEAVFARAETGLAGWSTAEVLRIKAEALLNADGGNTTEAEMLLHRSLKLAREQGALAWELRSATSLAHFWHGQRRTQEASCLLRSVRDRFSEGFRTSDLLRADALLETNLRARC
jgi:hypothetical protein